LEFADAMDLAIANTWFKKADQKLVTFKSGEGRTVVDYILVRKADRKLVKNVTVIQGEPSLTQHKLLMCMLQLGEQRYRRGKTVFVSKCKIWKLKDPEIRQAFEAKVEKRLATRPDGDVEVVWGGLRECLLDVAGELCGKTRGTQWHHETWWWNDEVDALVKERSDCSKSTESRKECWIRSKYKRIRGYMMKRSGLQRKEYRRLGRLRGRNLVKSWRRRMKREQSSELQRKW